MAIQLLPLVASGVSILPPRTEMRTGQYLQSPDKRWKLLLKDDSDLVLFDGPSAVWSAYAATPYSTQVYRDKRSISYSRVHMYHGLILQDHIRGRIWQSKNSTPVDGNVAAAAQRTFMTLQNDGNIVLIDAIPVWTSNTSIPVAPDLPAILIPPGTMLSCGDTFSIGTSTFVFQSDGNLVLYGPNGTVLWNAGTHNRNAVLAAMQTDGNFVIYDNASNPLWYSGTNAHPGAHGRIQANGSFSIITDKVVWARFGYTPIIKSRKVFYPDRVTRDINTKVFSTEVHEF